MEYLDAWLSAVTPGNIVSGFRKAGIYPFNKEAISCLSSSKSITESQADNIENGDTPGMLM